MEFLSPSRIIEKIKQGRMTAREFYRYFAATLGLEIVGYSFNNSGTDRGLLIEILSAMISIFIMLWGLNLCFEENQKGDDKDFIARYVALSLPVDIILTVVLVGAFLAFGIFASFPAIRGNVSSDLVTFWGLLMGWGSSIVSFTWKRNLFSQLRAGEPRI
jgi:hypothetical protein